MQQLSNPRQTISKGNSAQITVAVEGLPQFLIDANTATATGNIEQAKTLLTEQAIEEVEKIIAEPIFWLAPRFIRGVGCTVKNTGPN